MLSNITFLHQTTTALVKAVICTLLSNISFLHQTTTWSQFDGRHIGCQISLFYIKPQLVNLVSPLPPVVKYLFSTSNHNGVSAAICAKVLSNISFLHQTTTRACDGFLSRGCQISLFYIKPQRRWVFGRSERRCQISLFYIKPQLSWSLCHQQACCQISLFYIKPQRVSHPLCF